MEHIFKMAGDRAAHAMWCASGGDVQFPILSVLDQNNESRMIRLAFTECDEAMAYGKEQLETNESGSKGAVFIFDGFVNVGEVRQDALLVQIRGYEEFALECTLALPYRPASNEDDFAIYRPALWEVAADSKDLVQQYMDHFFDGVEENATSGEFWKEKTINESPLTEKKPGDPVFEDGEWELLCLAPYVVFITVAGADGTVDKKEVMALAEILQKPTAHPCQYLQKILAETGGNVQALVKEVLEGGRNPVELLSQVSTILDARLVEDEAFMFKLSLLAIGQQIAEASGGGFLGMGKKISKDEKQALAAIAAVLKVLQ